MKLLLSFFQLTRSVMGLIIVTAFIVSSVVSGAALDNRNLISLAITLFALTAGGFALNDYFDVEKDRINRPDRPIPAGRIKPREALVLAIFLFCVSVLISLFVGMSAFLFVLVVLAILINYSVLIRKTFLMANLITALLTTSPFALPALYDGDWRKLSLLAALTFLLILGREILKDILDQEGDRTLEVPTLPLKLGVLRTLRIVAVLFLLFSSLSFMPYSIGVFNGVYLAVVIAINSVLLFYIYLFERNPSRKVISGFLRISHFLLIFGLLGVGIGSY